MYFWERKLFLIVVFSGELIGIFYLLDVSNSFKLCFFCEVRENSFSFGNNMYLYGGFLINFVALSF